MKDERINEILAVFFLAVSLLLFVSLITFDSNDLGFYTSNPNSPIKNFAGVIGAYLGGLLVFFVGKAGFVAPLLALLWAVARFTGKVPEKAYIKVLGSLVLVLAASSLFSIFSGPAESVKFLEGGLIGLSFSAFLIRYFGNWGSYIILSALLLLSFLLATDFLLFPLVSSIFKNGIKLPSPVKLLKKIKIPKPKLKIPKPVKTQAPPKKSLFEARPAPQPKPIKPVAKPVEKVVQQPLKPAKAQPVLQPAASVDQPPYNLPTIDLLDSPPPVEERKIQDDMDSNSKVLEETLNDFGLEVKVVKVDKGPVITRYELEPAPGLKINRISALSDNIALAMKSVSVRIVAPIPGKGTVGVEIPNSESSLVYLSDIINSKQFRNTKSSKLSIALGKDISGTPVVADLADMPHLLIAGATGSGKTVCVNSVIASLLFRYSPAELKFIMVDPKMVELAAFNGLPHLMCPVVTDAKKVSGALNWVVNEMESRYELFAKTGSRNIDIYNSKMEKQNQEKLPYLIVIIDELADLMVVSQNEIENAITRLAQLSRAVGIHIILATQRPSVDVITGVIKANFPARISFKVASKVDSRTVLDMNGADKLLGRGDMLFIEPGAAKPIRAQGSLVSDSEIASIAEFIKSQREAQYSDGILVAQKKTGFKQFDKDEVFDEAVKLIKQTKQASVSMLQRRLGLGYTRAARIIDMMEDEGMVGPYRGSKPREILIEDTEDAAAENG